MSHSRNANTGGAAVSLAIAALSAVTYTHLAWIGYVESLPGEVFQWALLFATWVSTAVAAFAVARLLRASSRLLVAIGTVAWPVAVFIAVWALAWSSCAGWGPYECPFDG